MIVQIKNLLETKSALFSGLVPVACMVSKNNSLKFIFPLC